MQMCQKRLIRRKGLGCRLWIHCTYIQNSHHIRTLDQDKIHWVYRIYLIHSSASLNFSITASFSRSQQWTSYSIYIYRNLLVLIMHNFYHGQHVKSLFPYTETSVANNVVNASTLNKNTMHKKPFHQDPCNLSMTIKLLDTITQRQRQKRKIMSRDITAFKEKEIKLSF